MTPHEILALYALGSLLLLGGLIGMLLVVWGRRHDEPRVTPLHLPESEPEDWRDGIPAGYRTTHGRKLS